MALINPCPMLPYWGSYHYWRNYCYDSKNALLFSTKYNSVKNSWLNSTSIGLPNNMFYTLIIPIKGGRRSKLPLRDVQTDNTLSWQKAHYRKLQACYAKSIFWEEVAKQELALLYQQPTKYLLDWNHSIYEWLSRYINFDKINLTNFPTNIRSALTVNKKNDTLSILHYMMYFY